MVEDEILKSNITLVKTGYQNSYIGAEDCNFLRYGFYFIYLFIFVGNARETRTSWT